MRLISKIEGPKGTAKIYRDAEHDEYQVRDPQGGTYFTPDRDDAEGTACFMVGAPAPTNARCNLR